MAAACVWTMKRARGAAINLMLGASTLLAMPALAQPVAPQAPGFQRMRLGDFDVIALQDGVIPYQLPQVLPGVTQAEVDASLAAQNLSDPVGMSYNAYLVDTRDKLILIDTGTGGKFPDSPFFRGAGLR